MWDSLMREALMIRSLLTAALLAGPAMADEATIRAIVLSNAEHTMWHEAGHALVSEFNLPLLGQEEDAVDSFATLWMLEDEDAARLERLLDVAELWLISHDEQANEGLEPVYYGEHDLDAQRGLRVLCFIAGEGPGRAHEMVADWGLPAERAETCEEDYAQALDGWDTLLAEFVLREDEAPSEIDVVYRPSDSPWRDILIEDELLDYVAGSLAHTYAFEPGLLVEADDCGAANAFWDPSVRTITLCYELMDYFEDLATIAIGE